MNLSHVANKILLTDIKNLVSAERESTLSILYYLKEIDQRKLYSELNCTSLFDYCTRELRYASTSAKRRIVAARELAIHPEIAPKIQCGSLSLTNIYLVNQFIKDLKMKKEIFKLVEGLSKRECEKKLFEITGKVISHPEKPTWIILSDATMEKLEKLKSLMGKNISDAELISFVVKETIRSLRTASESKRAPKGPL